MSTPTLDQIRRWPATIDVPTAGQALGLGRDAAYRLARAGELPGAIRLGRRFRVVTARLIAALEADCEHPAPTQLRVAS